MPQLHPDTHKCGTLILREVDPAAVPSGRLEVFEIVDWTESGSSVLLGPPGVNDFPFKGGFWTADRHYFDILAWPDYDDHVAAWRRHLRFQERFKRFERPVFVMPPEPPTIWQRIVRLFQPKKG